MDEAQNFKNRKILAEYISFYENISPRSVPLVEKLVSLDIRFKDPFNDVRGVGNVKKIFYHMFDNVESPKFVVNDISFSDKNNNAYLKWLFTFRVNGKNKQIQGMSEVLFSHDGKISEHIDYWDAGENFYEDIPVLGGFIRWVKKKVSIES